MCSLGNVLLGGGTGFVGTALVNLLRKNGYGITIVSRMPGPQRISWTDLAKNGLPDNVVAVVNLAGQNVLDPTKRWTPGFKQNVFASRINTTASLADAIKRADKKPSVFLTVSGVGIYKPSDSAEYTEDHNGEEFDFLSHLCHEWEAAAKLSPEIGVRQVTIRSGVVLGRSGGMVQQIYLPFYLGLGGPMGKGTQYMPWIHISDLADMFLFSMQNSSVQGVMNGVAPEIITNQQFAKTFAKSLWRPCIIPLPEFALNLAFGAERAKIITDGQKVIPKKPLSYGFKYKYPTIESACKQLASNSLE